MNIDHRNLIQAYDLGHIEEHSPGLIHWHPNGQRVLKKLKSFVNGVHDKHNYQEVSSPILLHRSLWEKSGHWDKYQSNMFVAQGGDEEMGQYAIKPMSCPGHISIYQHARRSYRQLPFRLFEFGHVHRNEPSGALSGWMRLRGFVQDDSHVFARADQIAGVVGNVVDMVEYVYNVFGFSQRKWRLSLRPDKRAGSDAVWDVAEQALRRACDQLGIDVEEAPGEGAFYGPKLEAVLQDRLGREWQCGVAQVDFVLPERFSLSYQNADGHSEQPVLVHHAILGSLERWLSIVMEHNGELPDWLHPSPVAVLPISQQHVEYANDIVARLKGKGIDCALVEDGPLQGRLRALDDLRVPYRWVVGGKEQDSQCVAQRRFHEGMEVVGVEQAVAHMAKNVAIPKP